MVSPQALLIAAIIALTIFVGEEAVRGIKWIGHKGHIAGAKIVHVLKKIPHP